jgi:4-hydroxy-3-methylbut-2-en-1-yl diphosphate reductase
MEIEIDKNSGFCFGVEFAIQIAEDEMEDSESLYCLGDIVHNDVEVSRLNAKGLKVIDRKELGNIKNSKVLIRAHGEPPETYRIALENNLELIDASCPVVLKLQNRIKAAFDEMKASDGQVVIYGKQGHAEVIGLTGQTQSNAIVVSSEEDLKKLDFSRPIVLFSQTTKSTRGFYELKNKIAEKIHEVNGESASSYFKANDSICRQVSNREPQLLKFSSEHDVIIFVSGRKSSNGRALFDVCKQNNKRSYFVENEEEIKSEWFRQDDLIGVCGATSTPMWLMEKVAGHIQTIGKN